MAALIVSSGLNEGGYYPLGKRTTVIGRQETCPVQIVDDRISRKHLQIRHDPATDCFFALDMNSNNGSYINGHRITLETALADFDQITLGDTTLCFISADFPDQASALAHFKKHGQRAKPTVSDP